MNGSYQNLTPRACSCRLHQLNSGRNSLPIFYLLLTDRQHVIMVAVSIYIIISSRLPHPRRIVTGQGTCFFRSPSSPNCPDLALCSQFKLWFP
ncbi:hypothetical protein BJX61DRAFT_519407 [Aspergillus egyptiacus]|nr:hypothetical protein BJX61DRAFT_519407 [Aspergillus egyptiacus]